MTLLSRYRRRKRKKNKKKRHVEISECKDWGEGGGTGREGER